jgi:hypothetical protein
MAIEQTYSTPTGTEPLIPVQKDGKILRERLRDAVQGRNVYKKMREADNLAAAERAKIQAMIDGERPMDQAELDSNGLGEICNVNWGQAEQLLNLATSPYIDLMESVDTFITTPTRFGDPQMRAEWEQIMSEEFARMLRTWPEFFPRYLYLIQQFLAHGVVVAFFEDEIDWRPQIAPIGDFLIPRQTRASDEEIEVCAIVRGVSVHELFQKIEDPKLAEELGWDVAATKKAVMSAVQVKQSNTSFNWEFLQREFKNNDIGYSNGADASEVKLVFMWVREVDGTISSYIFPEADSDDKKFLFKGRSRFKTTTEAFTSFCYGIGTNGYFHSIRGLGTKIFSIVQALNRLRCRFYDGIMASSMMMLEAENEEAIENLSVVHIGPFIVKPQGTKFVPMDVPNYNQSVIPGMQDLNTLLQQQAGQYSTEAIFNAQRERTRYEVQAQLESLANINIASLTLFYQPWERLLKEVLRRVARPDYYPQDPGGEQVADFRGRCMERGVPLEAILAIDVRRAKVVRAIGNGSSAARSSIMQQIYQLSQGFDPQGKQLALRDLTRTIGGVEAADRYTPAPEQQRPPMEAKTAMLENNQLRAGQPVEALPAEMHAIHLPIHVQDIEQVIMAVDQGQISLVEATPQMVPVYEHSMQHAEFMQGDATYPMFKQRLQQLGEYINNGIKALGKLQREQAQAEEAAAMAPGEAPAAAPQPNPQDLNAAENLRMKTIEAEVKLRMAEERHRQDMRIRDERAAQEMAIRAAEAQARLSQ